MKAVAVLGYLTLFHPWPFALWSAAESKPREYDCPVPTLSPVAGTVLSAIFLGENIMDIKYAIALVLVCSGDLVGE